MNDLRQAAQQALEALNVYASKAEHRRTHADDCAAEDAITTLRAALAEPVEPVKHKHQWFSTGAMEPGEMRCIQCGAWAKEKNT